MADPIVFKHYSKKLTKANISRLSSPNASYYPYYTSAILSSIYQITPLTSDRVNVAIISLGGGYKESDLTNYWNLLGLATRPNVYSVSVDGATNSPGSGDDIENDLDIQTIGGIVPNSNIYVYFAPNSLQGFQDAFSAAANNKTHPFNVISCSWGAPEAAFTSGQLKTFNNLLASIAAKGITICVASGDNGSSDGLSGLNVDFPASSPNVLACGGTSLNCPSQVYSTKTTSERSWSGSGGGFSSYFAKPSYQNNVPLLSKSSKRAIPDVSADADPNTGVIVALDGQYYVVGGTSLSAPIWAGYLAGQNIGRRFVTPILYKNLQSGFHDIVQGSNGAYSARQGFDLVTGWGTPSGYTLTRLIKKN